MIGVVDLKGNERAKESEENVENLSQATDSDL